MSQEPECTLADFVRELVATAEEWQEWHEVKDASPPVATTRPAPPTSHLMYLREMEDPSPSFLKKEELGARLIERLRELLKPGDWAVTGRHGTPPVRRDPRARRPRARLHRLHGE